MSSQEATWAGSSVRTEARHCTQNMLREAPISLERCPFQNTLDKPKLGEILLLKKKKKSRPVPLKCTDAMKDHWRDSLKPEGMNKPDHIHDTVPAPLRGFWATARREPRLAMGEV